MDIEYPIDGEDITHWMPLPRLPHPWDEMLQKSYDDMVNSMWRPIPPEKQDN